MLDVVLLPEEYAVCRLDPDDDLPGFPRAEAVLSVTHTPTEVSVICRVDLAPVGAAVNAPWRCLRVNGPLDLALTGILASLVDPLVAARVNIFAFSTYDTDYLLVPSVRLAEALAALTTAGHRVIAEQPDGRVA